ncbi:MAG: CcmD family protein [Firmicutes bacterium]|nr:CcmD family protein [Bacillota bacterium]
MIFFTLGYAVVWLLIFGYTVVIQRQQSSLEKQVGILEEILAEGQKTE